jgi:diacylglycerol kinase
MSHKPFSISERLKSFKPALIGLRWFLKNEHNVRVHLFFSVVSILCGILFQISKFEWIAITLCIGMVISLETINSAIERLVDLVSPEKNDLAGLVKDIAAGAVLLASIVSIIVAAFIFFPRIK